LELRIFGGPSTVVQGREARLALKRAAALLWPDADESQGRTRLRRLIYTIEDTLGAKLLAADEDGIALLAQAVRIDALEFARFARRAAAIATFGEPSVADACAWIERAPPADAGNQLRIGRLRQLASGRLDRARASAVAAARTSGRRAGSPRRPCGGAAAGRGAGGGDLGAKLHRIDVPTLVMHRRGDRAVRFEAGEHLARAIPGAVWQPLEGADHFWLCGDRAPVLRAIQKFAWP